MFKLFLENVFPARGRGSRSVKSNLPGNDPGVLRSRINGPILFDKRHKFLNTGLNRSYMILHVVVKCGQLKTLVFSSARVS